jgi:hypothetical protein
VLRQGRHPLAILSLLFGVFERGGNGMALLAVAVCAVLSGGVRIGGGEEMVGWFWARPDEKLRGLRHVRLLFGHKTDFFL